MKKDIIIKLKQLTSELLSFISTNLNPRASDILRKRFAFGIISKVSLLLL